MVVWTITTAILGVAAVCSRKARIGLLAWIVFSVTLAVLGGPAID